MENLNYKNENIERKFWKIMQKKQFFKVKKESFRIKKIFHKLKDIELKNREVKHNREIEELFFKPIMVSIDDMGWFEKKEMKKIRPIQNTLTLCVIS